MTMSVAQQQAHNEQRLKELLRLPGNGECMDCQALHPTWASINLGIFICTRCSGLHRCLGVQISRVKSCTMDFWSDEQVNYMEKMGNTTAKTIWEALIPPDYCKPAEREATATVMRWIRYKYILGKYMSPAIRPPPAPVSSAVTAQTIAMRAPLVGDSEAAKNFSRVVEWLCDIIYPDIYDKVVAETNSAPQAVLLPFSSASLLTETPLQAANSSALLEGSAGSPTRIGATQSNIQDVPVEEDGMRFVTPSSAHRRDTPTVFQNEKQASPTVQPVIPAVKQESSTVPVEQGPQVCHAPPMVASPVSCSTPGRPSFRVLMPPLFDGADNIERSGGSGGVHTEMVRSAAACEPLHQQQQPQQHGVHRDSATLTGRMTISEMVAMQTELEAQLRKM